MCKYWMSAAFYKPNVFLGVLRASVVISIESSGIGLGYDFRRRSALFGYDKSFLLMMRNDR